MNPKNLQKLRSEGVPGIRLVMLSNKLVLNYASSIKTFIDMAQRMLVKIKPDSVDDFLKLTKDFYDNHMEYRFWSNFRNYIVHCAFPYTCLYEEIGTDCEVRCKKEHLLEFNNWKHSKADIEIMSEYIDLPAMVDKMTSLVFALYLQFFYYLANDIIEDHKCFEEFRSKYKVRIPAIMHTEYELAQETIVTNPASFQQLPINEMMEVFKVMQNHPSININFT